MERSGVSGEGGSKSIESLSAQLFDAINVCLISVMNSI